MVELCGMEAEYLKTAEISDHPILVGAVKGVCSVEEKG